MAIMEDESRGYDVEFVANRIYIYVGKYIDNNQTLEHSFELARRLIEKVGPIAGRLSGDTAIPKAPVNIIAHRAPSQRSRVLEFLYVGSIAVMVTVAIILGSAAHRQYARDVDESPAYLAAVKQAEVDDAAGDRGPRVVVDGQQALMAATTDLGRSGAEYWIGIGYFWQKLYATALAHEQQAISYDPKDSSAIIAAGNLLVNTDQNQAAITMANKELAIDASDASAYRVMAFAHYNLGMKVQALADINKATSLDQAPGKQQYRSGDAQDATLIQSSIYTKLIFDPN
jgi:tetratricopeptide (TPR) repeat protein